MNIKNQGPAFYCNVLAAILGIAGVILTIVSSTMTVDNALPNITVLAVAGIIGVILVAVAAYLPNRRGNSDLISAAAVLGTIALYMYTLGGAAIQRVMLIAGLFSYNANNTAGWNIFYVSVAAWVCLLVGIVFLIIGSFTKSVKETA